MTISVAEEARNATSVGDNRAHSDRRSQEDKCSSSKRIEAGTDNGASKKRPLCNGSR